MDSGLTTTVCGFGFRWSPPRAWSGFWDCLLPCLTIWMWPPSYMSTHILVSSSSTVASDQCLWDRPLLASKPTTRYEHLRWMYRKIGLVMFRSAKSCDCILFTVLPVQIQQIHDMEEVCYNKVLEQVKAGHQVRAFLCVWPRCVGFGGDTGFIEPVLYCV